MVAVINEKHTAWKCWLNGGIKNEYPRIEKVAKKAVNDARRVAEQGRFGSIKGG